jgi:hypothetical protein
MSTLARRDYRGPFVDVFDWLEARHGHSWTQSPATP